MHIHMSANFVKFNCFEKLNYGTHHMVIYGTGSERKWIGSEPEVNWKWTCVIGFILCWFALRYKQKNENSKDSLSLVQNLKSKQMLHAAFPTTWLCFVFLETIDSFSIHWHLKKMYESAGTKIDLVEATGSAFSSDWHSKDKCWPIF